MAKRMSFSVVGLPHYTIWHLYEPSVEDIRHMEELEIARKQHELEEQQRKERLEKINAQFDTEAAERYEKDKEAIKEGVSKKKVPKGPGGVADWDRAAKEGAAEVGAQEAAAEPAVADKITKEDVRAGIAESEVTFEKDKQGKAHLNDPLGEAKEVGGGGAGVKKAAPEEGRQKAAPEEGRPIIP